MNDIAAWLAKLGLSQYISAFAEDEIIRKTDGVSLFVEELTKTVLESGLLRETEECYVLEQPLERD